MDLNPNYVMNFKNGLFWSLVKVQCKKMMGDVQLLKS